MREKGSWMAKVIYYPGREAQFRDPEIIQIIFHGKFVRYIWIAVSWMPTTKLQSHIQKLRVISHTYHLL